MSEFPPPSWSVRFLQDMENRECGLQDENSLTMEAFAAIWPAGGQEGIFRFVIGGPQMLKLSFPISKILGGPPYKDTVAEVEMKPGEQIKMSKNSTCSIWWDLEDLDSSHDAVVTDGKGRDMGDEFLAAIRHNKELLAQQTDRPGLCIRWILGTREGSKDVRLFAQVQVLYLTPVSFILRR